MDPSPDELDKDVFGSLSWGQSDEACAHLHDRGSARDSDHLKVWGMVLTTSLKA